MRCLFLAISLALSLGGVAPSLADEARCTELTPCPIGERAYHVAEPDGWDGESPLPVLMHFHGWKRQGDIVIGHSRIAGATRPRGVLLVAPNGRNRSWNFWRPGTEDVAFASAVLADVAARYPIDPERIYISGYSFGGAMAWRFVCEQGTGIAALLAIAGTLSQSETCATGPREVRHVHGTNDRVMDFPLGPGGDTTYPVALWRQHFECGAGQADGTWQVSDKDLFRRTVWECPAGRVTLDLHDRGHFIPVGWIGQQLDQLLGTATAALQP